MGLGVANIWFFELLKTISNFVSLQASSKCIFSDNFYKKDFRDEDLFPMKTLNRKLARSVEESLRKSLNGYYFGLPRS